MSMAPLKEQERPAGRSSCYVDWEEECVSNGKGNRLVHYYVKDRSGNLTLAAVGQEKSLRHMVYSVASQFMENDKVFAGLRLRTRRDVLDWLGSLVAKRASSESFSSLSKKSPLSDTDASNSNVNDSVDHSFKSKVRIQIKKRPLREFVWLGSPWTCKKQWKHYSSFCHKNITISVNSFAYITSGRKQSRIAYIEDMFEDSKGRKLVKVKWFHKNSEVLENVPPPPPHSREVFFTSNREVVNVEAVDSQATVLCQKHFDECISKLPSDTTSDLYMCCRRFDDDAIRSVDISCLEGYWNQQVLSTISNRITKSSSKCDVTCGSMEYEEHEVNANTSMKRGPRTFRSSRRRNCTHENRPAENSLNPVDSSHRFSHTNQGSLSSKSPSECLEPLHVFPEINVGDKVELLSQDSGIRGCWFRCIVLNKVDKKLRVRYEDLLNDNESDKLEEWVLAFKIAPSDKLGIRIPGRAVIRPSPPEVCSLSKISVGAAVDVWWNDGWWEGIVIQIDDTASKARVYFPGENEESFFQMKNLRVSRDWLNNQWIAPKIAPEIVASFKSLDNQQKSYRESPSSVLDELTSCDPSPDRKSSETSLSEQKQYSEDKQRDFHTNENGSIEDVALDACSSGREQCAVDLANDKFLRELKWNASKKRKRNREISRLPNRSSHNMKRIKLLVGKVLETDNLNEEKGISGMKESNKCEDDKPSRSNQEHKNATAASGCPMERPLFRSTLPITNLVMSR